MELCILPNLQLHHLHLKFEIVFIDHIHKEKPITSTWLIFLLSSKSQCDRNSYLLEIFQPITKLSSKESLKNSGQKSSWFVTQIYMGSPVSTVFRLMRFCTIRGIALIGDWFSTKTWKIGQFKFQSLLFDKIFMWKNLLLISKNTIIIYFETQVFIAPLGTNIGLIHKGISKTKCNI